MRYIYVDMGRNEYNVSRRTLVSGLHSSVTIVRPIEAGYIQFISIVDVGKKLDMC